jgi:hypothetical protein
MDDSSHEATSSRDEAIARQREMVMRLEQELLDARKRIAALEAKRREAIAALFEMTGG